MRYLLKCIALWIGVSLAAVVLLFWHGTALFLMRPSKESSLSVGLFGILLVVSATAVLGAMASWGIWTLREGGRKAGVAFLLVSCA